MRNLHDLEKQLKTHNDEILPIEDIMLLSDLGYKELRVSRHQMWELVREDTSEQEVVEEILLREEPVRRLRTTIWEATDHGRHSKSIRYRKLPIGKKLAKVIANTKRELCREE